jgi:fluoride exporter
MLKRIAHTLAACRDWLAERAEVLALYAAVAAGSGIGGAGRHVCAELTARLVGETFPWGILVVNVIGSFVIGLFAGFVGTGSRFLEEVVVRAFVMAGLWGGYTTFSAFSLDTLHLMRDGRIAAAGGNVALSLVLCLLFVWLGHALAARLKRHARG